MKVYFDACCLSRLTDDQSQPRIREEADAIERIFGWIQSGTLELVSSEALEDEVRRNPSEERRLESETLLSFAVTTIEVDTGVVQRAIQLVAVGYGPYDALHVAAAESDKVDILLSTDDLFLKRVARGRGNPQVSVRNPVSWVQEQRHDRP